MVNVNQVKELLDTISNKNQSGVITPADYNNILAAVNYDFLKWRVGLPEAYQVGMPQAPIQYQQSAKITDDVKDLIVKAVIQKNNSGYFPIPTDYFAFSSWRYRYIENSCDVPIFKDINVDILSDNELNAVLDNTIAPPTETYPKAGYYRYGLKVYPETISNVTCTYLKVPATPVWTFKMINDTPVFDPSDPLLQNFEYPPSCLGDLANMCLIKLGINLREEQLVQYGLTRQQMGV